MIKKISGNEFQQAMESKVAVVDFSATWCGPCKMLAPVLAEVSEELAGKIDFYNVDIDDDADLAMKFGIQSVPTLVVFKQGEKVDQQVGFQPKEQLKKYMESQL
ncbi:MAG: thioredoxin [Lachnospiraceae bacterium]|nr:thioredoxin [Lachnospiraceae bacterium]